MQFNLPLLLLIWYGHVSHPQVLVLTGALLSPPNDTDIDFPDQVMKALMDRTRGIHRRKLLEKRNGS